VELDGEFMKNITLETESRKQYKRCGANNAQNMKTIQHWFGKWLILTILWFVLNLVDFSNLQLANTSHEALLGYAIMAILDSLILCWVLSLF
jgi:hypothetical protein